MDRINTGSKNVSTVKLKKSGVIIIIVAAIFCALCLWWMAASPPTIDLASDSMTIRGYSGTEINKAEISNVSLHSSTLEVVYRSNGTRFGNSIKGYFQTNEYGVILAFGKLGTEPWVDIQYGEENRHIFISRPTADETIALFNEIEKWQAEP